MMFFETRHASAVVDVEVPDGATEAQADAAAEAAWRRWADDVAEDPMHPDRYGWPDVDGGPEIIDPPEWPPEPWPARDGDWAPWHLPGEWSCDGACLVRRDWPRPPLPWDGRMRGAATLGTLPAPSPAPDGLGDRYRVSDLARPIGRDPDGLMRIGRVPCHVWRDDAGEIACIVAAQLRRVPGR